MDGREQRRDGEVTGPLVSVPGRPCNICGYSRKVTYLLEAQRLALIVSALRQRCAFLIFSAATKASHWSKFL